MPTTGIDARQTKAIGDVAAADGFVLRKLLA
jgi:hypothetical protein